MKRVLMKRGITNDAMTRVSFKDFQDTLHVCALTISPSDSHFHKAHMHSYSSFILGANIKYTLFSAFYGSKVAYPVKGLVRDTWRCCSEEICILITGVKYFPGSTRSKEKNYDDSSVVNLRAVCIRWTGLGTGITTMTKQRPTTLYAPYIVGLKRGVVKLYTCMLRNEAHFIFEECHSKLHRHTHLLPVDKPVQGMH